MEATVRSLVRNLQRAGCILPPNVEILSEVVEVNAFRVDSGPYVWTAKTSPLGTE